MHGRNFRNDITNDLEKYALKGNVWQVKQSYFKAIVKPKGKIECRPSKNEVYKGNTLYTFNEEGFIVEKQCYTYGNEITRELFNEQGLGCEYETLNNEGIKLSTYLHKFNANGAMVERKMYDKDDNLTGTTVFVYDKKGHAIDYYEQAPDGSVTDRQTFINDDNGNKIDQKIYKGETLERWLQYKYNEHGHAVETKTLDADGSVQATETKNFGYDASGKLLSINGKIFRDERELETYKYQYDHHGNWVKKIKMYMDIPTGLYAREINYYGVETQPKFELSVIPITGILILNFENQKEWSWSEERGKDEYSSPAEKVEEAILTPQQNQWVTEGDGKEEFNPKRYYVARFNENPSLIHIHNPVVEVIALRQELIKELEAFELFSEQSELEGYYDRLSNYVLGFKNQPYLLHAPSIGFESKNSYDMPQHLKLRNMSYRDFNTSSLKIFLPSRASGKRNREFEDEISRYINLFTLKAKPEIPHIYMVQVSGNAFSLQSYPVNENFEIKDLNINYGYGFEKFHGDLMKRFQTETRGLILFHGEPGTGKTYYIRHLLKTMATSNKIVIYMPPNMVDHLVDPVFVTFLSRTITSYSNNGKFCVLLIEDAEPLLAARHTETRIQGITNLLNMTDGLLNDMLKLQIICTFNVELRKLDKALLRPGRLIARKEFKAMSELDANLLAQRLQIKHRFTQPTKLAKVYALLTDKNTLIHDVDEDGNNFE